MKQKSLNATIIGFFFLILLIVPMYWMIPGRTIIENSLIENRALESFPKLPRNFKSAVKRLLLGQASAAYDLAFYKFINRSFQEKMELAVSDQFPFRIAIIQVAKTVDRVMIQMAYLFLNDAAIPADAKSNIFVMRDNSMMMVMPAVFNAKIKEAVDKRIRNYQDLIAQNPRVNFYVFYHETLDYSPYHPLNSFFPSADCRQTFQYFEDQKPDGLIFGKMLLTGMDDRMKYYYFTDHHWNIQGAWKAYEDIYNLIAPHYFQISPKLTLIGLKTFPGVNFTGRWARKAMYPIEPETFEVADVQLPNIKVYNRAGEATEFNHISQYESGNYQNDMYTNHYGEYFGYLHDQIEYVNENKISRNLLIIGTSYMTPVAPYIASHYHHTYLINLRLFPEFSLGKYIKQYDIDDVLVIGDIIAIGDPTWIINP